MKGTIMRSAHHGTFIAALATAAAISLAGCAAGVPSASSGTASSSGVAATLPATAGPTTSAAKPSSSASAPAALATYTFPDGRLSFKYPADWKVELFTGDVKPSTSRTATVFDASGTKQVTVYSGLIADGVTHPVTRTVFESAPVPGLQEQPAPAAHYSFYVDRMDNNPAYRMHLAAGAPAAGKGMALDGIIRIGKEVLVADAQFIEKPFASDAAAKAWLASAEGQAIKSLLLSVTYR
ncbi:hypothetical protein ASG92_23790 [Arthrobacter sp. Soil736]|nr:hypothetical protein ASG92_23790 [Arthrobacter sp. Soil736]